MLSRTRRGSPPRLLRLLVATAAATALTFSAGSAFPQERPGSAGDPATPWEAAGSTPAAEPPATVTLLTGDRVLVGPDRDGRRQVQIQPAHWPDRQAGFHSWQSGDEVYVVPTDVARLVPRLLDLALFNVTGLVAAGYHDERTDTLPLLAEHRPDAPVVLGGPLQPSVTLSSFPATAASLDKRGAAEIGAHLAALQRGAATGDPEPLDGGPFAGVERLWLDFPVHAVLDDNLTQIGAPAAWEQGLSGEGVRVAVLDSGIDTAHPDLADVVTAAADFTESPDPGDRLGHGTHVAAVIAGSGAAAEGRRQGVAYGAELLNAKVLDDRGDGTAAWVIAGMEWAVAQGADIVNLSLGSSAPSAGDDPVSLALDALSRDTDTLFVVAAGNTGPGTRTIGSPGAAAEALTVAAVDSDAAVADFSSRGPRAGDRLGKPDIAAPGVGIVAARAEGTAMGVPVDGHYVEASGTSMAAPHVAGAAAVLASARPDWSVAQLRSALVGSADPAVELALYDTGNGGLDLSRALSQPLVADRAAVSFATFAVNERPDPIPVILTNTGDAPITVDAELAAVGADATDAFAVTPASLTLEPGAAGTLTVAVDPAVTGDHLAGLHLRTDRGPDLRLPVSGMVTPSTATLSITATDRRGAPYAEGWVHVVNVDDLERSPEQQLGAPGLLVLDERGRAEVTVPVGTYSVLALIDTLVGDLRESKAVVGDAELRIDRDLALTLDAATAPAAPLRLAGITDQSVDEFQVGYHRFDARGESVFYEFSAPGWGTGDNPVYIEPTGDLRVGGIETRMFWRVTGADAAGPAEVSIPVVSDGYPDPPGVTVTAAELDGYARVETGYRALSPEPLDYRVVQGWYTPHKTVGVGIAQATLAPAPVTRTEYFRPDPDLQWYQCVLAIQPAGGLLEQRCDAESRTRHLAGDRSSKEWLTGPFDPSLGVVHAGDRLLLEHISPLADGITRTHAVDPSAVLDQSARIWRDGELIHDGPPPPAISVSEDGPTTLRIDRSIRLTPDSTPLPEFAEVSWTFVTDPSGADPTVPPVLIADVRADVDSHNRVPAGQPLPLVLALESLADAAPAPIAEVELLVTADGGDTWRELPLTRGAADFTAEVPAGLLPAGGTLGVRVTAADAAGNTLEQTVLGAIGVDD